MSSENTQLADCFKDLAIAMEIKGDQWRSSSYSKAADEISSLNESVSKLYRSGRLKEISGVGNSIASKIKEFIEDGKINALDEVKDILPEDMNFFRKLPLSVREIADVCIFADVRSAYDLLKALDEELIVDIPGLGRDVENRILKHIAWLGEQSAQIPNDIVEASCRRILEFIRNDKWTESLEAAGVFRRKSSHSAAFTLLAWSSADRAIPLFAMCQEVKELTHITSSAATGKTVSGAAVMLKTMEAAEIPFEQLRLTGPPEHIRHLKEKAISLGMSLDSKSMPDVKTEADIYEKLGLEYVPPEFRGGGKPGINIKGDLRIRYGFLEDKILFENLIQYLECLGYEYVCLADSINRHATPDLLRKRNKMIDNLDADMDIIKGIDAEISPNGTLDAPDDLIESADFVIASVNSKLNVSAELMTERISKALEDPRVDVWGHPSNVLIGIRERVPADFEHLIHLAVENGIALEINASPYRSDFEFLDLCKVYEPEASYSIGTDAVFPRHFKRMDAGKTAAEKAELPKRRVLNTFTSSEIRNKAWRL